MSGKTPQTIHKQGYLFKQGTFFSTWNERYFSLETSLLKQFTDAETALPTYSLYLGTAAVDGLFSPEDNADNGHGPMWSFVVRWPLPSTPDMLEEQWGFMHLASYEREEIEEWYDSLVALIKVEQTKRIMNISTQRGSKTPPEYFPVPSGHTPSVLSRESEQILSLRFQAAFAQFVEDFNTCAIARKWKAISSDEGGLLCQSNLDPSLFKFTVSIPKAKAGPKRIWETVLSANASKWEPLVKQSSAVVENQDVDMRGDHQILTDQWTMKSDLMGITAVLSCDRVAFRDDKSGIYIVLGLPAEASVETKERKIGIDQIGWAIESVSDRSSVLAFFLRLSAFQADFYLAAVSSLRLTRFVQSIVRPSAQRLACFILSQ
jgi:hypothetical protein